jgi:cysteine-rich repeat protein
LLSQSDPTPRLFSVTLAALRPLLALAPLMGGCVLGTSGLDSGASGGGTAGQPSGGAAGGAPGGAGGTPAGGQGGLAGGPAAGGGGSSAICGNAIPEPGEECDDGNALPGDGCELCTFDCLGAGGQVLAGHCYFTRDISLPWFEAKQLCELYGGTLAVVNSDTELALLDLVATDHWIGAHDAGEDGFIEWVTLEPHWTGPVTLDWPWAGGHPKADEFCVKMKNQQFETRACRDPHGRLICEVN